MTILSQKEINFSFWLMWCYETDCIAPFFRVIHRPLLGNTENKENSTAETTVFRSGLLAD